MAVSKRIRPIVEWAIIEDGQLNATPTPDEIDDAYAYAVDHDCVVKLKWTTRSRPDLPNQCYIYAECDVVLLKYDFKRLLSDPLSISFGF